MGCCNPNSARGVSLCGNGTAVVYAFLKNLSCFNRHQLLSVGMLRYYISLFFFLHAHRAFAVVSERPYVWGWLHIFARSSSLLPFIAMLVLWHLSRTAMAWDLTRAPLIYLASRQNPYFCTSSACPSA
jgi:hypothetical protein